MSRSTSRVTTLAFIVLFLIGLGVFLFPGAEPNHSDSDRPDPAVKGSVESDPEAAPQIESLSTAHSIESEPVVASSSPGDPTPEFDPAQVEAFSVEKWDEYLASFEGKDEQIDRRDSYSRHFRNEDGTMQARISASPIHYQDTDGTWKKIGLPLLPEGNGYSNKTNTIRTHFPASAGEIRMDDTEKKGVTWNLTSADWTAVDGSRTPLWTANRVSARVEENRIYYDGVFPGASDQYEIRPGFIKHDLVLETVPTLPGSKPGSTFDVNGILQLDAGLRFLVDGELAQGGFTTKNPVVVVDSEGTVLFTLGLPLALDATGQERMVGSYEVLSLGSSRYEVRQKTPADWLLATDRQYPVRIDPTLYNSTVKLGTSSHYDNPWPLSNSYQWECYGNESNGADWYQSGICYAWYSIAVGADKTGVYEKYRSNVEWDVSSIAGNATINSVGAKMYPASWTGGSFNTTSAYVTYRHMAYSWGSGTTPAHAHSTYFGDTSGGNAYASSVYYANGGSSSVVSFNSYATSELQSRINNGDWFAVGMKADNDPASAATNPTSDRGIIFLGYASQLQVVYTLPDTTPPQTTITSAPSGNVSSTSATISYSSNESGSTFQWKIGASNWVNYGSSTSVTFNNNLPQGSITFQVRAIDSAGNVDPTPASVTWTVDTVAPNTTITSAPSGTVASTSATITYSSTESGGSYQWQIAASNWINWSANNFSFTNLPQGSITFQVRAVDSAGNVDASPATVTWTVDTVAPSVPSLSSPAHGSYTNDTTPTFSWGAISDANLYQIQIDNNSDFSSPVAYPYTSSTSYPPAALSANTYYWRVRARDAAGNWSAFSSSRTLYLDTSAPTGASITIDSGNAYTTTTTVTLSASASGAAYMRFKNDSGSWSSYESYGTGKSWTISSSQGTRYVYVQFMDLAGNQTSGSHYDTIVYDSVAPTSLSLSINGGDTYTNSTGVTLSPSASGASYMRFKNESNGSWTGYESYSSSKSWSVHNTQGTRYVYVQFKDAAGNETNGSTYDTIVLDTIAPGTPSLSSPANGSYTNDTTPSFSWGGVSGANLYQIQIDNNSNFSSPVVSTTTSAAAYTSGTLSAGTYYWRVQARDAAGNWGSYSGSRTLYIDTTAPTGAS
ncbi:MAG: Ig-like domain-containing protein, partial [Planctomycetota bacterium]|nr:Ig-like domain-containing protein [Planctomycetota bacterium]